MLSEIQKASSLKNKLFKERTLLNAAGKMIHKVYVDNEWIEFPPTRFIYAFIAFDAIYSIDWKQSWNPDTDTLHPHLTKQSMRKKEDAQQREYIEFCFGDKSFSSIYIDVFKDYVSSVKINTDITAALDQIRVQDFDSAKDFRQLFYSFLEGDTNCESIISLTEFIYKNVRCNLFHGVKSISDLKYIAQQDRFNIYSAFIIGLGQMVFSFLDFNINPNTIRETINEDLIKLYPPQHIIPSNIFRYG